MKGTTPGVLFFLAGLVATFFGIALAQDGSNSWYILGVAGIISIIYGFFVMKGREK